MKTFRDKVIEHRAALGLSQKQLADKAGIGVRTIGNYESGARLPYAAQLYKLAKALGVSTEYLKNNEIEDPRFGLDRMEYVEEMHAATSTKDSQNLEEKLKASKEIFARGTVSEEAKDAYFRALMDAYLECKNAAKETFDHKKD